MSGCSTLCSQYSDYFSNTCFYDRGQQPPHCTCNRIRRNPRLTLRIRVRASEYGVHMHTRNQSARVPELPTSRLSWAFERGTHTSTAPPHLRPPWIRFCAESLLRQDESCLERSVP